MKTSYTCQVTLTISDVEARGLILYLTGRKGKLPLKCGFPHAGQAEADALLAKLKDIIQDLGRRI